MSLLSFIIRIDDEYLQERALEEGLSRWVKDKNEATKMSASRARVYVKDWAMCGAEAVLVVDVPAKKQAKK